MSQSDVSFSSFYLPKLLCPYPLVSTNLVIDFSCPFSFCICEVKRLRRRITAREIDIQIYLNFSICRDQKRLKVNSISSVMEIWISSQTFRHRSVEYRSPFTSSCSWSPASAPFCTTSSLSISHSSNQHLSSLSSRHRRRHRITHPFGERWCSC